MSSHAEETSGFAVQDMIMGIGRRDGARRHRQGLLAAAVVGLLTALAGPAAAQPAPERAAIRVAHLSPDTPPVDVYLTPPGGTAEELVLSDVGYAQASAYADVEPGGYAFVMRPAGSAPDTPGVLTLSADVAPGQAYTFAALGRNAAIQRAVLVDSLEPPPAGQARVRLIQAAADLPLADVAAVDGPVVASGVPFATATDYAAVPGGTWTLRVSASGDPQTVTETRAEIAAGTVVSLVLVDAPAGGVELTTLVDAGAPAVVPEGSVPAGGGLPAAAGGPGAPVGAVALMAGGGVAFLATTARRRTAD